jgi:hypothetical protein
MHLWRIALGVCLVAGCTSEPPEKLVPLDDVPANANAESRELRRFRVYPARSNDLRRVRPSGKNSQVESSASGPRDEKSVSDAPIPKTL